ncbi:MAG: hypothetical protein ACI9OE_002559 [Mariniflexile sp.]|jgi:hypothetical protein
MKKLLILFVGILVLASCSNESVVAEEALVAAEETAETTTDSGLFSREGVKVSVCHKNGGEIVIDEAALNTHIAHGDAVDRDGDGFYDVENPCSQIDCDDNAYSPDNSCAPPEEIGDQYKGGLVFYFFVEGDAEYIEGETHGLVCALSDYKTSVEWGCNLDDLLRVPNFYCDTDFDDCQDFSRLDGPGADIGYGERNTISILLDCFDHDAAKAARSYGEEWFLPSIQELNKMYVNKNTLEAVEGFDAFSSYYWSSTEGNYNAAWAKDFNLVLGNRQYVKASPNVSVRAVRAF